MFQIRNKMLYCVVICILIISASSVFPKPKNQNEDRVRIGVEKIRNISESALSVCEKCNLNFEIVIKLRNEGVLKADLVRLFEAICIYEDHQSELFCQKYSQTIIDTWGYIIDETPNLTPSRICSIVKQKDGCYAAEEVFNWNITLPPPNLLKPTRFPDEKQPLKILHLSDIHFDPNYTVGALPVCNKPLCCQPDEELLSNDTKKCGYWSSYGKSDVPFWLIEETFRELAAHDFDFVYFTGDIVSHRDWDTTSKVKTKVISTVLDYMKKSFSVPVFPVLGNHEAYPSNMWPPNCFDEEQFLQRWLLELAEQEFSALTRESVSDTIDWGGYYTVSPRQGFRVIAINSNVCFTKNAWLIYENVDPLNQLQWLVSVLKNAEDVGEFVHIIMHFPPGENDCFKTWSREYSRIVDRFQHVIQAQFTGHTHLDEWQIYFSNSQPSHPINVMFNGASITPYVGGNPSFKIYESLSDYEEWTFNLTRANSQPSKPIHWYKLYSFREAYGAKNLTPHELGTVLGRMIDNSALIDDYRRFMTRDSDEKRASCDEKCKKATLCSIVTSVSNNDTQCNRVLKLYNERKTGKTGSLGSNIKPALLSVIISSVFIFCINNKQF